MTATVVITIRCDGCSYTLSLTAIEAWEFRQSYYPIDAVRAALKSNDWKDDMGDHYCPNCEVPA